MTVGDRVRLRPVEPGDLPRMYELQLDPDSNRMAVTIPRTREAFDSHWANSLGDPNITARVILVGEELVGVVSCFPRDGRDHVGYWIDRAFWGQGIASRALHLLLEEVARRPLVATAATSNGASMRVLQKCGFVVKQVHLSPTRGSQPRPTGAFDSSCIYPLKTGVTSRWGVYFCLEAFRRGGKALTISGKAIRRGV